MVRDLTLADHFPGGNDRPAKINRAGGMVLYPLTEVIIGMLMAVCIGCRQFMMDILRHSKRGESKEDADYPPCHSRSQYGEQVLGMYRQSHHDVRMRIPLRLCIRR